MRSKNCTIAKPKPISETAVRIQDIIVRSTLSRVRSQPKCVSAVTLTSNRSADATILVSPMRGLPALSRLRRLGGVPQSDDAGGDTTHQDVRNEPEHQGNDH